MTRNSMSPLTADEAISKHCAKPMSPEQKAALVIAQAALLYAEVAGMVAENMVRGALGETPVYEEACFLEKIEKYERTLHRDAVLSLFNT